MAVMCLLAFCSLAVVAKATSDNWSPKYVWPLGDNSVYKEVMQGQDAHLPATNQCFRFSEGYPGLPYRSRHRSNPPRASNSTIQKAITLTGQEQSFVDFYLNGGEEFRDLALSLYIFPSGQPEGTILNFLCETGDIFKIAVLQGLLFVSFWDEFGVSVGATALPDLLVPNTWSHLVVSREYVTGSIKIYHNGVQVEDIDDDFPNQISLPSRGSIRLGSSQKDKSDHKFKGSFSCFQIYTRVPTDHEVGRSRELCLPDNWNIQPVVNLDPRTVDGQKMECVTGYVVPQVDDEELKSCDVIDVACISSGTYWNAILRQHKWTASSRDNAHFHLIGRDHLPEDNDDTVLGEVVTRGSKMICPRLCMRVNYCKAYTTRADNSNTTRCVLYSRVAVASRFEPGAAFFSIV